MLYALTIIKKKTNKERSYLLQLDHVFFWSYAELPAFPSPYPIHILYWNVQTVGGVVVTLNPYMVKKETSSTFLCWTSSLSAHDLDYYHNWLATWSSYLPAAACLVGPLWPNRFQVDIPGSNQSISHYSRY